MVSDPPGGCASTAGQSIPREHRRQKDVEQVVLEVRIAGQPVVALAKEEVVGQGQESLLVLRCTWIQGFPGEKRRLRDPAATRFKEVMS